MKKISAIIISALILISLSACSLFAFGIGGTELGNYEAIFDRNGFIVFSEGENFPEPVIVNNRAELDEYIQLIIKSMTNWIGDNPEHLKEAVNNINDFYAKYNDNFFKTHRLVLALIDTGSSRLSFSLDSLRLNGDLLIININRYSPMIQTMDFWHHMLFLSVAKDYAEFSNVKINLNTVNIDR